MKKLCHIYYNTSGISGLYLNPINDALAEEYEQMFFVNYYYPLEMKEYKKIFFRLTERNEHNSHGLIMKNSMIRKLVRFVELKQSNQIMFDVLKKQRPDIVNYSLTNMPDAFMTVKKIKRLLPKAKVIVTCHDVVSFQVTSSIDYEGIYNVADYLLVHTENAKKILGDLYGVDRRKMICHPFPIIDLNILKKSGFEGIKRMPTFLYIGVMRQEKGVQNLINAWEMIGEKINANLIIAGFKPKDVKVDFRGIENCNNVDIQIKTLSDTEYIEYVSRCDYVVFPYVKVGNSGVLSSVVSMCKVPVVTKLPTFMESPYCSEELSCEPDDASELAKLLLKVSEGYGLLYEAQRNAVMKQYLEEKAKFHMAVVEAYRQVV